MIELSHALPKASVEALVPEAITEVVATNVKQWKDRLSSQVPTLSLFVWDEMVHRGKANDPFKIAPWANNHSYKGGIYSFVQKELGAGPVTSAFSAKMFRPGEVEAFVAVSLVRCFPNDIHICDIEFSDHARPIEPSDPTSDYRDYHSLHLFPEFIARLTEVAKDQRVRRISLMAAHPPLKAVFEKYGFHVSETEMAKRAAKIGFGFPMILEI